MALLEAAECDVCVDGECQGQGYHIMQALELEDRFIVKARGGVALYGVHTVWAVVRIHSHGG